MHHAFWWLTPSPLLRRVFISSRRTRCFICGSMVTAARVALAAVLVRADLKRGNNGAALSSIAACGIWRVKHRCKC